MVLLLLPVYIQAAAFKPFDVLDTAYLWPYGFNKGSHAPPTTDLLPVYTGSETDLLSAKQKEYFVQLMKFASNDRWAFKDVERENPLTGAKETSAAPADSWNEVVEGYQKVYMSAFRFEICGEGIRSDKGSFQEIQKFVLKDSGVRLVHTRESCEPRVQVVTQHGSNDSAVHLIYKLPKSITEDIVQDLVALKQKSPVSTNGLPLGVHPGLTHETQGESFSKEVLGFVKKYALSKYLVEMAIIATNEFDGGDEWVFASAEISNEGKDFEMKPHLALEGFPISQGFGVSLSSHKRSTRVKSLNRTRWYNKETKRDENLPVKDIVSAIEDIMNPSIITASATDCKSCHSPSGHISGLLSHPRTFGLSDDFKLFQNTSLFKDPSKVFYLPGVTGFPDSRFIPSEGANFRAFGWFKEKPTVNFRAAMKSAAVAQTINKHFLKGASSLESKDCSANKSELMVCLFLNAGKKSNCMERLCRQH